MNRRGFLGSLAALIAAPKAAAAAVTNPPQLEPAELKAFIGQLPTSAGTVAQEADVFVGYCQTIAPNPWSPSTGIMTVTNPSGIQATDNLAWSESAWVISSIP